MMLPREVKTSPWWPDLRAALEERIDKLRLKLETCDHSDLSDLQARVKEIRRVVRAVEEGDDL